VNPETFDRILRQICDSHVFLNNSYVDQLPVAYQLAIALFHFGHFGSAISVESVTQWAGCSAGMVVKCTQHIMLTLLPLHDQVFHWPNAEEKAGALDWVEQVSCAAWWPGYCMVDGTLIPLFEKPGHFGKTFFDHKSNYSLNLTVWS